MTPSTITYREEGVYDRRLGIHDDRPISIFVPQKLEERYAYPLVVFFHGHGQNESQWLSEMIHLSRRNYVGVALRGPHPVAGKSARLGFGWGRDRCSASAIEDYAQTAIEDVRSHVRIDPRRIHLAGFGEGASVALQLGLSLHGVFSKIVAFNGWLPNSPLPLGFGPQRLRGLQRPRILLGYGPEDVEKSLHAHQLLDAGGLSVDVRSYSSGSRLTPAMLRDADRWLMGWWTR
jgi:phospholipase/carboxylesterase